MMKMKRFASQDEFEAWVDERQENGLSIDEIVTVVDDGKKISVDLTTECVKPETAIRRMLKGLGDIPELDGWQACMTEAVANGVFDESAGNDWAWGVDCPDENTYYVYLIVYRAETEAETVAESEAQSVESEPVAEADTAAEISEKVKAQFDIAVKAQLTVHTPYQEVWLESLLKPIIPSLKIPTPADIERHIGCQEKMYNEMSECVQYVYTVNENVAYHGAAERTEWVERNFINACKSFGVDPDTDEASDYIVDHEVVGDEWFDDIVSEFRARFKFGYALDYLEDVLGYDISIRRSFNAYHRDVTITSPNGVCATFYGIYGEEYGI